MKVAIIGPGALGCLFAARLTQSGVRTTLVDYRADRAARLRVSGITLEDDSGSHLVRLGSVTAHPPAGQDLVIVLTKAYSTNALRFPVDTPVLTLQNGLGNVEILGRAVGSAHVLAGTTCEAALLLGEGRVRHTGCGVTTIGSWTSCSPSKAIDILGNAGFTVELTETPGMKIWEKAVINAGINPLTGLLDVPNGKLMEIPEVRQLLRDLVVEAAKVASTEGYRFEYSLVERTEEVCEQTAANISSMLQDIRAGKPTEIDAISGQIVRRAQEVSLPTPRTRMVWQLVKGLEQR